MKVVTLFDGQRVQYPVVTSDGVQTGTVDCTVRLQKDPAIESYNVTLVDQFGRVVDQFVLFE